MAAAFVTSLASTLVVFGRRPTFDAEKAGRKNFRLNYFFSLLHCCSCNGKRKGDGATFLLSYNSYMGAWVRRLPLRDMPTRTHFFSRQN